MSLIPSRSVVVRAATEQPMQKGEYERKSRELGLEGG
jgi:hypothetical protein